MDFDRRSVGFRLLVGVGIVAALVYGVGWSSVLEHLQNADLAVFAVAPVASALALLAGGEGTRLALGFPARSVRGSLARRAFFAATFVRNFVPAGNVGGGAFVAYTVSRHADVDVSEALAGVTSWEFVMMVASAVVGGLGVAGVLAAGGDAAGALAVFAAFAALLVAAAAAVAAVSRWRGRVADGVARASRLGDPVFSRLVPGYDGPLERGRVRRGLDAFFEDIGALAADRWRLGAVVVAAHTAWVFWVVPLLVCLLAVGLVVPPAVAMVAVAVSGFARAVPLPGGVGPVDAALGSVLAALTPHSLGALASALVLYRAGMLFVQVAVGGIALGTLDVAVTGDVPAGQD